MSSGRNRMRMPNQYSTVAYTADLSADDTPLQIDMLLPSECPEYHYFSVSSNGCLPCSMLCRNVHKCHRRPECDSYRTDYMGVPSVPPWLIAVIVVVVVLAILGVSVFLAMKFKMKLCELCKGCKLRDSTTKKNRFGARDGSTRSSKALILPPRIPIQQGYEKPPIIIDLEFSRRRSVMDRFLSSIAAHPPTRGVDEMEPLKPPKPERTKQRPKEKRDRRSLDTAKDSEKKLFIQDERESTGDCEICVKGPPDDVKRSHDSGSTATGDIKRAPSDISLQKKDEMHIISSPHSNGWVDHNPNLPRDRSTPLDGPVPELQILFALTRTSNPSSRQNSKTSLNRSVNSVKDSTDFGGYYPQTTV